MYLVANLQGKEPNKFIGIYGKDRQGSSKKVEVHKLISTWRDATS